MPVAFGDGHGVGNPGEGAQGREPTGGTQGRETVLAKYVANCFVGALPPPYLTQATHERPTYVAN